MGVVDTYQLNGNGIDDRRCHTNEKDGSEVNKFNDGFNNIIPPQVRDLAALRRQ